MLIFSQLHLNTFIYQKTMIEDHKMFRRKTEGVEIPPEPTEERKMELALLEKQYQRSLSISHWASQNSSYPNGSLYPNSSQQNTKGSSVT